MEGLTPGRIVHYQPFAGEFEDAPPMAAIITEVISQDGDVGLAIFDPNAKAVRFRPLTRYSEEPIQFRWNWIPRA